MNECTICLIDHGDRECPHVQAEIDKLRTVMQKVQQKKAGDYDKQARESLDKTIIETLNSNCDIIAIQTLKHREGGLKVSVDSEASTKHMRSILEKLGADTKQKKPHDEGTYIHENLQSAATPPAIVQGTVPPAVVVQGTVLPAGTGAGTPQQATGAAGLAVPISLQRIIDHSRAMLLKHLQPDTAIAEGNNPDKLTNAQVGAGYRLLTLQEIEYRDGLPDTEATCPLVGRYDPDKKRWDGQHFNGTMRMYAYRIPVDVPVPVGPTAKQCIEKLKEWLAQPDD